MKKLSITVAALLIVMGTAFASGDGVKKVRAHVIPSSNDIYRVIYEGSETEIVKIRVRSEDGKLILTDRVKSTNGFMKPYNMAQLEKGTYYFELTDKFGVITEKVELLPEKESKLMAVKSMEGKKYQLIVDQDGDLPLVLTIYNGKDEVIHQERYKDISGFTRVYDLSEFSSDNFTFELLATNSTSIVSVD